MRRPLLILALAAVCWGSVEVWGQEPFAEIGTEAPPTYLAEWYGPEPAQAKDGRAAIRVHLLVGSLQHKTMRAAIRELSDSIQAFRQSNIRGEIVCEESAENVLNFLGQQPRPLPYRLGRGSGERTFEAWRKAFHDPDPERLPGKLLKNREKICYAMLTLDGKVFWHGHPLSPDLDWALYRASTGTLDLKSARTLMRLDEAYSRYLTLARKEALSDELRALGRDLLADAADYDLFLTAFARKLIEDETLKEPDLELALEASLRGARAPRLVRNDFAWSVVADAYFFLDRYKEAYNALDRAMRCCADEQFKAHLEAQKKHYADWQAAEAKDAARAESKP
ncbi:MAG: hypothetical protein M5U26_25935 [Planctomycetota bacterium]|nr:hypothetical protein [Planctomycetota bacterium]